jgi:hypothetical protein
MKKTFQKIFYRLGALTSWLALGLQLYIILANAGADGKSYTGEIIRFFSYMTILTNLFVALYFTARLQSTATRWVTFMVSPLVEGGMFVYIFMVGAGYYFLLANTWSPTGLQYVADVLLHYAVPGLYCLYWLVLVDKTKLPFLSIVQWLLYPAFYFAYTLLRGELIGVYPYPFMDVIALGYEVVLKNSGMLLIAYVVVGAATVLISRLQTGTPVPS